MRYPDLKRKNKVIKRKSQAKSHTWRWVFVVFFFLLLGGSFVLFFSDKARALFDPVTVVANINGINLKETDGRTNILFLGSDRRTTDESDTPERADTILVASIGRLDNNIVLISIPRDLWVSNPVCGKCKINEVYAYAHIAKEDEEEALQASVEDVLGIPIHYYAVVNFDLFVDAIDTLGGVRVDVERAFDDYAYPVEGMEAATCGRTSKEIADMIEANKSLLEIYPCRYEQISFGAGEQTMDGVTALRFVRSRKGTNGENTDFARSARQQKVIMALKDKATSLETLVNLKKLADLYALYKDSVSTNIDFSTVQEFYVLARDINFEGVRTIVLDDRSLAAEGGLLYSPMDNSLYGGKYVLLPKAGDYSQVRAYVQRFLFGE